MSATEGVTPRSAAAAIAAVRKVRDAQANVGVALLDNILAPPPSIAKTAISRAGARMIPLAWGVPKDASLTVKWSWFVYLTVCATGKKEKNINVWVTWLLSLAYLLYPSVLSSQVDKEFVLHELGPAELAIIQGYLTAGEAIATPPGTELVNEITTLNAAHAIPGLPALGGFRPADLGCATNTTAMYGYFGVICFCITKDAAASGSKALLTGRPNALLQKYRWSGADVPMLGASLKPSAFAFGSLTRAWQYIPASRVVIISHVVASSSAGASVEDEAAFTSVRLMKWGEIGHMAIVGEFLQRFPDAWYAPFIAPEVAAYVAGIRQLLELCPVLLDPLGRPLKTASGQDARDRTLMPYIKILYGDKLDVAMRKNMNPLIAIAREMLLTVLPDIKDYIPPKDQELMVERFKEYHAAILAAVEAEEKQQE
jgi:hypothetical protein